MEFHEKLLELRKQKGLTQEELAERLYVSRTAVSKWESGRGFPNIDSLKAVSEFFGVTVDDLLSDEELLAVNEKKRLQRELGWRGMAFGVLDMCTVMLPFLPIFADRNGDAVRSVSLPFMSNLQPYVKVVLLAAVLAVAFYGALTLAMRNCRAGFWIKYKSKFSIGLSAVVGLLFILSLQPYPAVLMFVLMGIKLMLLLPKRR